MTFKFLEFVSEHSVSLITIQATSVNQNVKIDPHPSELGRWQQPEVTTNFHKVDKSGSPSTKQGPKSLAIGLYLSTSAKIHTYTPLNGELIAGLLMMRKQCEQSAAAMNPLVRWKRFHIWSGGKNEVKWWNIDYVSSSNRRRLPERITNEKFMFIIHKPAAYASTVSIYIINIAQYCKIYIYYSATIYHGRFHDFEKMQGTNEKVMRNLLLKPYLKTHTLWQFPWTICTMSQ